MLLSSGEREPRNRGRAALVVLVVIALAIAGVAVWYVMRAPSEPAVSPKAAATPSPTPTTGPAPTGTVEISASVPDAVVLVGGRRIGPAPQSVDLKAGAHDVRVEKEGFRAFEMQVQIIPGRTLRLEARLEARLEPRPEVVPTRLRVDADVSGAQVFLDRQFVGETPVTVSDVELGEHGLNVSAEGYEIHSDTIEIGSGLNEIVVRFKEVRLDEALAVKHKHGVGSCRGRLLATLEGLRYEADHEKDGFSAPFSTLEPLDVDYLKKNLRVKIRGGRKYNFTADSADDLLVFQKAVEAARARLQ